MTLDNNTKVVLKCNVSACSEELIPNNDLAWITVCGHIFCANCGTAELANLPTVCPFCSHQLTSPYDIMKSDIFPPSHFLKMVLMGLNPDDCLEAARSGIQFWQSQYNLQLNISETSMHNAQEQCNEMQRQHEEKIAELSREVALLREECHQLKEELFRQSSERLPNHTRSVNGLPQKARENAAATPSCSSVVQQRKTFPAPSVPGFQHQAREIRGFPKKQFMGKY